MRSDAMRFVSRLSYLLAKNGNTSLDFDDLGMEFMVLHLDSLDIVLAHFLNSQYCRMRVRKGEKISKRYVEKRQS